MEPEGSVASSHEFATGPCPEPGYSSPRPPIGFLQEQFSCPTKYAYLLSGFGFPHQNPICIPLITHMIHMPGPSHSPCHYLPNNILCVCVEGGGYIS